MQKRNLFRQKRPVKINRDLWDEEPIAKAHKRKPEFQEVNEEQEENGKDEVDEYELPDIEESLQSIENSSYSLYDASEIDLELKGLAKRKSTIDEKEFNKSVESCFSKLQPTEEELNMRIQMKKNLTDVLQRTFPDSKLVGFGSYEMNLYTEASDMDFSLVISRSLQSREKSLLYRAKNALCNAYGLQKLFVIPARVPVLQLQIPEPPHFPRSFDVCINRELAHYHSQLIRAYCDFEPRARQLIYIVKKWAQVSQLYNPDHLSSFTITNFVVYFLQHKKVLPNLQERPPSSDLMVEGWKVSFHKRSDFKTTNTDSLGTLFVDFLQYFLNFDFKQIISIRRGPTHKVFKKLVSTVFIEDPFDLDNNVSKNINPDTLRKIFFFCKYSLRTLHKKPDFEALCTDIAQIAEAKKEAKKLLQNRRKRKSGKKQKS